MRNHNKVREPLLKHHPLKKLGMKLLRQNNSEYTFTEITSLSKVTFSWSKNLK